MIITRTPFRISFAGGGSDIADYYLKHGGAVLSTSIDKYVYLSLHPHFMKDGYLLKYSQLENARSLEEIRHPIVREVFRMYGIKGIDFNSSADVPAGTGLASSSAFTVGLVHLCNAYTQKYMSKDDIAELACRLEIDILREPIGKQDQYACACGGLNYIEFHKDETVSLERIYLSAENFTKLQDNLMMFFTGETRAAGSVLLEQKANMVQSDKTQNLHKMVGLASDLKLCLLKGEIDALGEILHMGWLYKKELATGISNPIIDEAYEAARNAGAAGGKLLGAGGGGFLLFYVEEKNKQKVRNILSHLKEYFFRFDCSGTGIIHHTN